MMPLFGSRQFYGDRKSLKRHRSRVLGGMLAVLLGYLLITTFFVETWKLETDSMSPGYPAGSRVFVHPYLMRAKDGTPKFPPNRGDFIVFRPPYIEARPWYLRTVDSLIRLTTFQTLMLGSFSRAEWENDLMLKRVIAVPGDAIRIEESVAYVKGREEDYFISEFEASGIGYDLALEVLPREWISEMPLSGNMDPIVMGENEYFVLGDNRAGSNDSRYWGTLTNNMLYGRVFFSYWPPGSFGRIQ